MKHAMTRGRIAYYSLADGTKRKFGEEWFSLTWHADGQITLNAQCEIEAGVVAPREVLRNVVYTMDSRHQPIDCYNRLHQNGAFLGAGWMRFTDESAECDVRNVTLGQVSQRWPLKSPALSLGAHPLCCDMFHLPRFDRNSAEHIQRQDDVWMTSLEHDGCSGPLLTKISFGIEYVGRENVIVEAGEFETDHYRIHVGGAFPQEHPVEECWCLPGNFTFVKIAVGGYMNSTFELIELEHRPSTGA